MNPVVLLDRDGVINVDDGYTHKIKDLKWIEGAQKAIKYLNSLNYKTAVCTNQAGVARGYFAEEDVHIFHQEMHRQLSDYGAKIDLILFCPYHPDGIIEKYSMHHYDRKPNPGMLIKALKILNADYSRSFMIGDKSSDIMAAKQAGVDGYLFDSNKNLYDFIHKIISSRAN
jgi:D-glycero-D-manno-heptose 1,7-bisphosphate phosphatase